VSTLPVRADANWTPRRETLATTAVAPLFVELCFKRPRSRLEGEAGVPFLQDLIWTHHLVRVANVAAKSAAPLLARLLTTLAPLRRKSCVTSRSLRIP